MEDAGERAEFIHGILMHFGRAGLHRPKGTGDGDQGHDHAEVGRALEQAQVTDGILA